MSAYQKVIRGRDSMKKLPEMMEKLGMTYCGEATITKFDGSETLPAKEYRRIF